jgi:hypothetical protein
VLAAALLGPLSKRAPFATAAATALACGLLLVPLGSLPERLGRERALFGFDTVSNFTELSGERNEEPLPSPYRSPAIAAAEVVAEAPSDLRTATVRPLRWLAKRHGKRLVLVATNRAWASPRVALRTVAFAAPEAILASRADALVLHTRQRDEGAQAARRVGRVLRPHEVRSLAARDRLAVELERVWTAAWGAPDASDAGLAVWDLRRIRRRSGPTLEPRAPAAIQ